METPKQKEQYLFIDILRIIACFFVIVNHSVDKVIYLRDPSDIMWWVSMAWFFLSKFAVPIFLMITGYNLLDRVDSPKKSLIRVCRIAAVLILVSGFYYIFQWLLYERGEISARQFLIAFLKGHVSNALWYLYLYLGILIMLPFLQKLASVLTKQNILFLLAVSGIVFGLYPIVVHYYPFMAYTECFELPLFGTYIGMLFIGLYMKKYAKRSKLLLSLSVIGVILPVVCNVILTKGEYAVYGPRLEMLFFDNRELFPIVLQSASLFYLVMYLTPRKNAKAVQTVGGCTFGIYLLGDMLLLLTEEPLFNGLLQRGVPEVVALPVWEIAVFASGLVIAFLLRCIPGVRRLI